MPDEITPALTPDEWASPCVGGKGCAGMRVIAMARNGDVLMRSSQKHELAALCLHGQPFGFDREDVALLQLVANVVSTYHEEIGNWLRPHDGAAARNLAARIAALLPPEGDRALRPERGDFPPWRPL